jgi:release factor glutamine methyltransferase
VTKPTTVRDARREGEKRLKRSPAIEHWPADRERRDAEDLLKFVLDAEQLDLDRAVPGPVLRRFRRLVRRRAGGEPIPYIVGWTEFRDIKLTVRPGAFVPRQSSEFTAEQAARRLRGRRDPAMVDLATGVGPIALSVASEVPGASVHGTDLSPEALRQARLNARALRLGNVVFHRGDLFAGLPARLKERVDVVTLHPPYVPRDEMPDLPLEVRGFEPEHTLTDFSPDGLSLVERTVTEAWDWLRPGGWLLIEVSPDRSRMVKGTLQRAGYGEVQSTKGWPEITRVVVGRA